MRKIKEVMRLNEAGVLSRRGIASSCKLSPTTVGKILSRAETKNVSLPEDGKDSEEELLALKTPTSDGIKTKKRPLPEMDYIAKELNKKGVTRQLLWEEYREEHPEGYGYTQFCEHFNRWKQAHADPTMRFEHRAGDKMFVDWAGQTMVYFENGLEKEAYLFVAVLGASNYTYSGVYPDMKLPNWIRAHIDAYNYFGGVPVQTVPDNAKTGVLSACRYDPDLNPAYHELSKHYGTVVQPARPGRPRDKAKVENAVQFAEHWIIAGLRKIKFLSFGQLKEAVRKKNVELNCRSFTKREGCREELFNEIEKGSLSPLPAKEFSFGKWKKAKVYIDYHIQADNHYYSVPYQHIHKTVEVRMSSGTVEVFLNGVRIAIHQKSDKKGKATTLKEHMPPEHSMFLDETTDRLIAKAQKTGPECGRAVTDILSRMPRPEMGFRSCQGIIRLAKHYGRERLEQACANALELGCCRYRDIDRMLKNKMENVKNITPSPRQANKFHRNIRGAAYYQSKKSRGNVKC
jgi:transposase